MVAPAAPAPPPINPPPLEGRGWRHPRPEDNGVPSWEWREGIGRGIEGLPEPLKEAWNKGMSRVNDYVFRSGPPGAPVPTQPGSWTFAVLGDYGSGSRAQEDVAKNIAAGKPDLIVTVGDNVYFY